MLRYQQVKLGGYKKLVLNAANRYLDAEVDLAFPVYPGTLGDVIYLMLGAYEITGEKKYLDRADYFAQRAVGIFLNDGVPLPRASSKHAHYEAITRGDTLMMALLDLWATKSLPEKKLQLIYNDR